MKSCPNNELWITKDIKRKIYRKNIQVGFEKLPKDLGNAISTRTNSYKSKLEENFNLNRIRNERFGLTNITGCKTKHCKSLDPSNSNIC